MCLNCSLTEKSTESQVTGVSAVFNRRSRFSWSLPAIILNTWRSSNNQTAPRDRPNHRKNNIEESIRNDYSFPLPLADKDATLKDSEIAGNKGINGILHCINEGQPTIYETEENDESDENKKPMVDDIKPEIKNKLDSHPVPKTDDDKTFTVKQKHVDVKPGSKSKENITTSYSIPIDYKWKNDSHKDNSLNADNKPTVHQKHLSPIYIEMDDVVYEDENNNANDLYSVPIDSVNDSKVISENNKHIGSPTRGKQVAKPTTSLPIITDTMQSNCKPHGIIGNRNSFHDDDVYSVPVDDINSNTPSCKNIGQRMYTPPLNSPSVMNFNPSYKRIQANDSSITEYSDPVTTAHISKDDPFAAAVANIQSTKKHKHKPVKPVPYKSKSTSTGPRQEDPPIYEEVLQTAATLPSSNGLHHNLLPTLSLNKTKKTANTQEPLGLDDYTVPSTDMLRLQKNPSYGDVCDTTETSDYTYVPTNRLIRTNVLEDACTTYTEC